MRRPAVLPGATADICGASDQRAQFLARIRMALAHGAAMCKRPTIGWVGWVSLPYGVLALGCGRGLSTAGVASLPCP